MDYKPGLVASTDLRFSVEVLLPLKLLYVRSNIGGNLCYYHMLIYIFSLKAWFSGEKIGEGIGKSRREALRKASEVSIQNLAGKTF